MAVISLFVKAVWKVGRPKWYLEQLSHVSFYWLTFMRLNNATVFSPKNCNLYFEDKVKYFNHVIVAVKLKNVHFFPPKNQLEWIDINKVWHIARVSSKYGEIDFTSSNSVYGDISTWSIALVISFGFFCNGVRVDCNPTTSSSSRMTFWRRLHCKKLLLSHALHADNHFDCCMLLAYLNPLLEYVSSALIVSWNILSQKHLLWLDNYLFIWV